MIELFFLAFFLPKRMRILARERDRSALRWTLAAIGAWLGVEFMIIFAWAFIYGFGLASPKNGGAPIKRAGNTLSILQKQYGS